MHIITHFVECNMIVWIKTQKLYWSACHFSLKYNNFWIRRYGAPEIFDIFNRQAFVYYNVSDPEPALNYIAYLESNTTAYDEVQGQPILAHGVETVAKYFSFSDALGGGQLKKRIKDMLSNDVLY